MAGQQAPDRALARAPQVRADPGFWGRRDLLLAVGRPAAARCRARGSPGRPAGRRPGGGLPEYARLAAAAIGGHHNAVLVSHSLGAFTAPMAAAQSRVAGIVLVNAMIPEPGETPGAWWDNTGQPQAQAAAARRGGYSTTFDLHTYFLHDVPADIAATGQNWPEEAAVFESACDFRAWPPVPVKVAAGADDRLFPLDE